MSSWTAWSKREPKRRCGMCHAVIEYPQIYTVQLFVPEYKAIDRDYCPTCWESGIDLKKLVAAIQSGAEPAVEPQRALWQNWMLKRPGGYAPLVSMAEHAAITGSCKRSKKNG